MERENNKIICIFHIIWLYSKIHRYITKYPQITSSIYTTISIITNLYCNLCGYPFRVYKNMYSNKNKLFVEEYSKQK